VTNTPSSVIPADLIDLLESTALAHVVVEPRHATRMG
jgi:hypothetical protein